MARVIAICNAKGGVGKTTTAVNLGAYLALAGKRVLLVDFDPQANASSHLGVSPLNTNESVYHGILDLVPPRELIKPSLIYNFHLIPSAPHLAGALVELVGAENREYFLRNFLNHLRHEYDYIFIDLSPSLSLLTVNALAASDEIIIPVQAEYYSLEGLGQLLQTIEMIQDNLNHTVKVKGALLTMYDKRENLGREVAKNLRQYFKQYRLMTDAINIKDPYIVNIGIDVEIITYPDQNSNEVLLKCVNRLIELFDNDKMGINEPIIISKISTEIDRVEGVQTVVSIKFNNLVNRNQGYQGNVYDCDVAIRNGILYPSVDPTIFEVRFPKRDLKVRVAEI